MAMLAGQSADVPEKTEDVVAAALRHRKGHEIDATLATLAGRGKAKCIMGNNTGGRRPAVWIELHNGS